MSNSYRWSSQWRNSSLVLSLPGGLWSLLWLHPQPPMENSTGAPCTVWRNRLQYEVGINSSCDWLPCWQCLCKRRSWQISSHCHGIQWIVIILFLCFLLVHYLTKSFYSNPDFWIPAWWPISDGQLHCCTTQLNLLCLLQQLVATAVGCYSSWYELGMNSSCDWLPCWQCLYKLQFAPLSSTIPASEFMLLPRKTTCLSLL